MLGYIKWIIKKVLSIRPPKIRRKYVNCFDEGYFGGLSSLLFAFIGGLFIHWVYGVVGLVSCFYFITHAWYRRENGEE